MESGPAPVGGHPSKHGTKVIAALIVVVISMGTTILVMVLDDLGVFDSPYPSESTALDMIDGAVTWTCQLDFWMYKNQTFDYRNLRLAWFYGTQWGMTTDELANYSQLNGGTSITVTRPFLLLSIHVTDILGNGLFERGDFIVFDYGEEGILKDTVYTVSLADVASEWNQEVSFAVHGSDFYSWNTEILPADYPWWIYH